MVVTDDGIQRAPYFVLENVFKAKEFVLWVKENFTTLQEVAASTTRHGKLESFQSFVHGRMVYLRLKFSTGDAMGMNMITKASHEVCHYIIANFPVQEYAIESNMAVDKKPAHINSIMGRGKTVTAEIFMKKAVISRFLRTTAKGIDDAYRRQVAGGRWPASWGPTDTSPMDWLLFFWPAARTWPMSANPAWAISIPRPWEKTFTSP